MSRGYGKYRRGGHTQTSFLFDNLFKENSNKPSAARSAATVGKWGITSFTSIRTLNGLSRDNNEKPEDAAPKPKKFFKSRNADSTEPPAATPAPASTYSSARQHASSNHGSKRAKPNPPPSGAAHHQPHHQHQQHDSPPERVTRSSNASRKFFASKNAAPGSSPDKTAPSSGSGAGSAAAPPPSPPGKPPIVLRICRGKSQLLNDSDESESTPTPSSTPSTSAVTSPRAPRDTAQRSPNCRITRSARRSMQQDPSSSPATADTPGEFSLFTSPKQELDLSPQYIPAEKYELERRAMYDNLLRPNSPREQTAAAAAAVAMDVVTAGAENREPEAVAAGTTTPPRQPAEEPALVAEVRLSPSPLPQSPPPVSRDTPEPMEVDDDLSTVDMEEDDTLTESRETIVAIKPATPPPPSPPPPALVPVETQEIADEEEDDDEEEEDEEGADEEAVEEPVPTIAVEQCPPETVTTPANKIEDDWSSDSDSNSTAPEEPEPPEEKAASADVLSKQNQLEEHKEEILDKILEKPAMSEVIPKLVITKKKGSIFKSRPLISDGTKKRRALYKHKWSDDKEGPVVKNPDGTVVNTLTNTPFPEFDFNDDPLMRVTVTKEASRDDDEEEVTSVKCTKGDKGYYTVVRNVKKAHQIQEIGEFQEFNDDVEYILDALQDNNPISTRCLSAISLATKCMVPAFRMHVRAHGTVAKFFKALHDATKDQSLGLCTATVMFVLSQDRLNMDLDRDCLELMLNLLESDVSYQQALDVSGLSSAQLEKNKQKVRELCAEMQSQGHAMHLNLDNITVGQLAMETLLSLTSKRAGEWFKEELRELGGLEHIMKTICECCRQVSDYVVSWTDTLLDKLRKVDRCLRVLENVTHNNEENQTYLLKYNNGVILDTLVNLYKLCDGEIPLYPVTDITDKQSTGAIIREALLVTLKVLITLTHHFNDRSMGSTLIGARAGVIETSLHLLLQVPHYIPEQKKFELGVLVLMLLINLIQDNASNKKLLMEAKAPSKLESIYSREESAVEALIVQFYDWEHCAKLAERRTDAILDGEKDGETNSVQYKSNEEFIEETVAKLLQKAGTHMEYTFLASYIVLLVGFLMMDNEDYIRNLRQFLRGNNFSDMVEILNKFYNFMNLTASTEASSVCAIKATKQVLKLLEDCDKPLPAPSPPATLPHQPALAECMDLSYSIPH